jgi:LacI family transcriptional regulator
MPGKRRVPHVMLLVDTAGAVGRGIVEGISRYALEGGPWSIQFEYRALDSLPPEWLNEWNGDGIIARSPSLEQATMLQSLRAAVVELHGCPPLCSPMVTNDIAMDSRMIVEHLWGCGLRRFGWFAYGEAWWVKLHRDAFSRALYERGGECLVYDAPTCVDAIPRWHENQQAGLTKWLRSLPRPIGIVTPGDLHSVRLLDACRAVGLAVPEDVAILGMGNDPVICQAVRPTLSSLDFDARRLGYEAANLLARKMAGKPTDGVVVVPPSHVAVRQSTDFMAIEDADMARAMRYIRDHACKGIDVSHMAAAIGLSRSFLERGFRQYLGRSPKAEIMRVRVERAKQLLIDTDKTSENLAKRCGFASLDYFTKAFRREVGMTPLAYRKLRRISRNSDEAVI